MGLVQNKQPSIRFDLAGPFGFQGVSWVRKVINGTLLVTQAGNVDFWVAPVDVGIVDALLVAETVMDGSGTITLGVDGNADALVDDLDWDPTGAGAFIAMRGSATADSEDGLYLPAGDTLRLTAGGTPTVGEIRFVIEYYELADMFAQGEHFTLSI